MEWLYLFLVSLACSLAIESVVIYAFTRLFELNISNKRLAGACLIPTMVTLPIVWWFPLWINYVPYALGSEIFAMAIESVIIYKILKTTPLKAVIISVVANMASFLLGNVIMAGIV
jgi:hypothetical protein